MEWGALESPSRAFQAHARTVSATTPNLVDKEGFEPSSDGCRPSILPLNDSPVAEVRIELTSLAYETKLEPPPVYSALKLGTDPPTRTVIDRLSSGCPAVGRGPYGNQNLEPEERIERSSAAYHAAALPLSYTGWSRDSESN